MTINNITKIPYFQDELGSAEMKPSGSTDEHLHQQTRSQVWGMSFCCVLLFLLATAASTKLSDYLAISDYPRLFLLLMFNLLTLAGLIDNIRQHIRLLRN